MKVTFRYYHHFPKMSVVCTTDLDIIPMVGDKITLPDKESLPKGSRLDIAKSKLLWVPGQYKVVSRELNMHYSPRWDISIEPIEPVMKNILKHYQKKIVDL